MVFGDAFGGCFLGFWGVSSCFCGLGGVAAVPPLAVVFAPFFVPLLAGSI